MGQRVSSVGNVWRRSGFVVGIGVAAVGTVLTLVVQAGGAVAGTTGADGRTTVRALTTTRGTAVGPQFFGMHAPLLGEKFPNAPVGAVDLMTGGVYWSDLETSPGVFSFTKLDSQMAMARQHGTPPLIVLGQTPSFHIAVGAESHGVASVPDMDAWKTYVTAVVT